MNLRENYCKEKKELKIEKEEGNELRIIFNDQKIYI